jgi:hypothetical protein
MGQFPADAKHFSLLHNNIPAVSCLVGKGRLFPEVNETWREADLSSSGVVVKNE